MKWFKHQSDARNSLKLRKVRRKFGAEGYAIYWFCLEAIAYEVDKDNLTFELKEDAETIAFELNIQEKRVQEIMLFMVEIGLFETSSNMITCMKLAESIDKSMTNSPKMRAWLETKSVMTLPDATMTPPDDAKTCPELEVEVEVEKNIKPKLDFSPLAFNSEEIKEFKAIRSKKRSVITQRVIDEHAKQFNLSRSRGYSNDDVLNEWLNRGWTAYKDEWMRASPSKPKQPTQQPIQTYDIEQDFDLL